MASMASLVSLGSVMVVGPSERSRAFLRRVGLNKRSFRGTKTWHCISVSVCKYSVSPLTTTTTSTSEHGNSSVSLRGSSSEADFVLKPPTRPVLKSEPLLKKGLEDRTKVIESLGQVLEKAEKLETSSYSSAKREPPDVPQSSPSSSSSTSSAASNNRTNNNTRNSRTSNTAITSNNGEASPKSKTLKSVWRKGDTVASVQKVVKEFIPKPTSEPSSAVTTKQPQQPLSPLSPPPPQLPQLTAPPRPKLQAKPSVKRAVILKDVGASGVKERKPILVDKFAPKKGPVVDPLIAQAVLTPTKPAPSKFKDDYGRKKTNTNTSMGGRRRKVDNDDEEDDDEESSAVSIPGKSGRKGGRKWSKASRKAARLQAARDSAPVKAEILEVYPKGLLISDLAYSLTVSEGEILGYLYSKGIKPDGVQTLDRDIVKMVCREYGVEVIDADPVKLEDMARKKEFIDEDDLDKLQHRPPVITIMGHVDHGKTTLLDCIRKTRVASSEAGGITQGIGAYKVQVPIDGKLQSCVFLDTPGHEAFGAMRARGARVTDIAIIVVAADDGIRPQTKEAIAHAKVAGVPIIIAINKIDRDGASPDRVMQELSSIGLMPEDWGGDIPMVQISALKGENVNDLLETVMLVAELQELKANPLRSAKGTVIEAGLDKSKGPLATLIVQNGTLKRGDIVVCGEAFGKVRALFDDGGNRVNEAGPSIPVQVIGLNSVPISGDEFEVVESLDMARKKAASRTEALREERISAKAGDGKVTLSSLASAVASGKLSGIDLHQLNIIMKVDVQGSIEAVKQALQTLPQDNVTLKFLLEATGDVTTSDVDLAVASKAIVLGFNVKALASVKSYADNKGIEIRLYGVIYELIDDVRNAMEGLLEPVEEQLRIGEAEVRAVFSSGSGRVAGCMVTEGKVVTGCGVRVVRKGKVVHVGVLNSLRRVKEIVKEVNNGLECGIGAEEFDEWEDGDKIEAFQSVEKRRTLEEASASIAAALEGVQL